VGGCVERDDLIPELRAAADLLDTELVEVAP
jgi:hypothetical protein